MIPIKIRTVHEHHPDLVVRELRHVTKATHEAIGRHWYERLLPEHFTPWARSAFNHSPRSRKYIQRKMAAARNGKVMDGGTLDLVATGALRRMVLGIAPIVKGYPSRATVKIFGPTYFQERPRNPRRPNMARELKAVSDVHGKRLQTVGEHTFTAALAAVRATKTTKTKGR